MLFTVISLIPRALLADAMQIYAPTSALIPAVGQTASYRILSAKTSPNDRTTTSATVTFKTIALDRVEMSITVEKELPRYLKLHVDRTGALETPVWLPAEAATKGAREAQERMPTLWQDICLAARLSLDPGSETTYPVPLSIPWAREPVNPMLTFKSTDGNSFTGDAAASTSISLPRESHPGSLNLGIIPAVLVAPVVTLTGKVAFGAVASIWSSPSQSSSVMPADVKLHLSGQLVNGKLQSLSADQECAVHVGKRTRNYNEHWTLTAQ